MPIHTFQITSPTAPNLKIDFAMEETMDGAALTPS